MQLFDYVSSVGEITESSRSNEKKANGVVTKYFDFFFHTKDNVRRGVCFSPQKRKILKEIEEKKQGCLLKKIKLSTSDNDDFTMGTNSSVTPTELVFPKIEHVLKYTTISR